MIRQHEERLLAPRAVADRLAIAPVRVSRWIRDGVLPSVKLGKSRRIPESAVLRLMQVGCPGKGGVS